MSPQIQLSGHGAGRGGGSATLTIVRVREYLQQNRWLTGVLVFLILVPPIATAALGRALPTWAGILIAWFIGLLAAVIGIRAIITVREREVS